MDNLEKFMEDIREQKRITLINLGCTTDFMEEMKLKMKITELKTVEKYVDEFVEWELQDQRKHEDSDLD